MRKYTINMLMKYVHVLLKAVSITWNGMQNGTET